jgi:hypothetical protein
VRQPGEAAPIPGNSTAARSPSQHRYSRTTRNFFGINPDGCSRCRKQDNGYRVPLIVTGISQALHWLTDDGVPRGIADRVDRS